MWVLVVLALLGAVWLAVVNALFRRIVLGAIGLAAIAVFALYEKGQRDERDYAVRQSKIPHSLIVLEDVKMTSDYGTTHLTGTVKNNSPEDVQDLTLSLELFDCPSQDTLVARCLSIGKDDHIYLGVEVPAHSARSFDGIATLENVAPAKGIEKSVYNLVTVHPA